MRGIGDSVTKERTFGGSNKLGDVAGLMFEIRKSLRGVVAAVNSFQLRAFGFFVKDLRGNEWLVRAGRTRDSFHGGVLVEDGG